MTIIAPGTRPGTTPYLSPLHVAEVVAAGGFVVRNDHFGALILWPGVRIEQHERLPDGRVERIDRRPDGSIVGLDPAEGRYYPAGAAVHISAELIPEAADDARAAWRHIAPGGHQPTPADAAGIVELCGARIVRAPAGLRLQAISEAVTALFLLERAELTDPTTGSPVRLIEPAAAARLRARLEAALALETAGAAA